MPKELKNMSEEIKNKPDKEERLSYGQQLTNLREKLKSVRYGDWRLNLMEVTGSLCHFGMRPDEDTYKIWDEKITLKRELINDSDGYETMKFTIKKLITPKGKFPRITTYELSAVNYWDFVAYRLRTDDGRGHVDEEDIHLEEFQETIIPNFKKRIEELKNIRKSEHEKKKKRMQDLAYNDKKEADDMIWKLDDSYSV